MKAFLFLFFAFYKILYMKPGYLILPALFFTVMLCSCGDSSNSSKPTGKDSTGKNSGSKDTSTEKTQPTANKKPPVINIIDTVSIKRTIICLKDSAASMDRVGAKLGAIYGKVSKAVEEGKCKVTGAPMAWYRSEKAPYFFEAGMPVDKKPAKLPAGAVIKETGQEQVVVAHFFGPYELLSQGYDALKEWMTSHKKEAAGAPYEIYIGDPGIQKDPYKVQTDIVFPIK